MPAILEVSLIARLIVGSVEIIDSALKAGVHYGQVLIGQSQIDDKVGFVLLEQSHKLLHVVGVNLVGSDVGRA